MTAYHSHRTAATRAGGTPDSATARIAAALQGTNLTPPRPITDLGWPLSIDQLLGPRWQRKMRPAAVLVGIVERPDLPGGASVILTERSSELRDHAGQVAFPGGAVDPGDKDAIEAAKRETCEEIGMSPTAISPIGVLPDYPTTSRFCITPVVARVQPQGPYVPEPGEVAAVFEVPLGIVLDKNSYKTSTVGRMGVRIPFYEFTFEGFRIWGATAGMLYSLAHEVQTYESAQSVTQT